MENIFCLESHIHLCSRHTSAIPAYVIKTCVTWHAISGTRYWGFVSPKLHVSTYRNQQHCWWFHDNTVLPLKRPPLFVFFFFFFFGGGGGGGGGGGVPKNKKTSICIMDLNNLQQLWISIIALWVNMFARLWISICSVLAVHYGYPWYSYGYP